jgi:hypothetical protein
MKETRAMCAQPIERKTMSVETETTEESLSPIEAIYSGECPSLSGQSTLTYAIGRHPEDHSLHLRIVANTGGGMFCDEWASGSAIDALVQSHVVLISRSMCELHAGRSINTGGFVLSILKHLGLVRVNAENSRHHEMVPGTTFEKVALETLGHGASDDKRKTLKLKKGEV